MKKLVIDISEWNSNIDFNAWITQRDLWGVIIRVGGSSNSIGRYDDSDFKTNYQKAKQAGLHIGTYYYSVATNIENAKKDAEHCAQLLSGYKFDLPVYMDVEDSHQFVLSQRELTNVIKTFCDIINNKGYYAGIYMSGSPWLHNVYKDELMDYANWIAWWRESWPTEAGDIGMWQQGTMRLSDGDITYGDAGSYGYVDCDWCVVDYPSRINKQKTETNEGDINMATVADLLKIAQGEVGYSRWNDPQEGTKYGRWYAQKTGASWYGASGIPYCAMFVSWVLDKAGVKCNYFPSAVAFDNSDRATLGGAYVNKYNLQPGDVISFDWDGDVLGDHVGFVKEVYPSYVKTIEGNTDNGIVAEKIRYYSSIICGVRPRYSGSSNPSTPTNSGNANVKKGQQYLVNQGFSVGSAGVDGYYGNDTKKGFIKFAQTQLNKLGANLVIDGIYGNYTRSAWNTYGPVYKGTSNSILVRVVQVGLLLHGYSIGSAGVDGSCGNDTDSAIRAFQKANNLTVDGYAGPATFTKLC